MDDELRERQAVYLHCSCVISNFGLSVFTTSEACWSAGEIAS